MKILGYDYALAFDGEHEIIGAFGRFHPSRQLLQIANNITPQQVESTVLHEILEALNYHLELGLDHSVIMSLEAALYQVLTDAEIDLALLTKELGSNEFHQ